MVFSLFCPSYQIETQARSINKILLNIGGEWLGNEQVPKNTEPKKSHVVKYDEKKHT